MDKKPLYWGSWKGQIVKAISIDGAQTWTNIRDQTGLSPTSINRALAELMSGKALEKKTDQKSSKTIYRVPYDIYTEYKEYFEKHQDKSITFSLAKKDQDALIGWIREWKEFNELKFDLAKNHFYLTGKDLADFSLRIIPKAKKEVFVVNPFITKCDLSDTLNESPKNSINTYLITRKPKEDSYSIKEKVEYLDIMKRNKVNLFYMSDVHAKIILVDRMVAIVSSMNFYPNSTSGKSWEVGLVTIEPEIVDTISNSVQKLLYDDQTKKI